MDKCPKCGEFRGVGVMECGKCGLIYDKYETYLEKKGILAPSLLWDRNNPLFFYGNEQKLNDLTGRVYGEVVKQVEKTRSTSAEAGVEASIKFGSILSKLGLAEGNIGAKAIGKVANEKKFFASIPFEQRLSAVIEYCSQYERFPYIDLVNGVRLSGDKEKPISKWNCSDLAYEDTIDSAATVFGLFLAKRISPDPEENSTITRDVMDGINSLWLLETVPDSSIKGSIPIITKNIMPTSQSSLFAFIKSHVSYFKIEAIGLVHWENGSFTCDPIAWRLFY